VPALQSGSAANRPVLGSRDQARRLSPHGAPGGLTRSLLHQERPRLDERFPAIVDAAYSLKAMSFLIDGEAVILGDDGTFEFDALRSGGAVAR
jgi:hypothetical protein